jgi:hypothetical protein
LPPLSVHFPSSLCPPEPRRTLCSISSRIISYVIPSNATLSFHSFHNKTPLHPSDCKSLIHFAKKSVLTSPSESIICALFHKTPGVCPTPVPNPFPFFPQRVNTHPTATPATLFFSRTYSRFSSHPGWGPTLFTHLLPLRSQFSGFAHPTGADQIHTGPIEEKR